MFAMLTKKLWNFRRHSLKCVFLLLGLVLLINITSIFLLLQGTRGLGNVLFLNYRNWFSTPPRNGLAPYGMNSCTVIVAAKLIGAGKGFRESMNGLGGIRHLFINYYENTSSYGLIEATHYGTNYGYGARSVARIKIRNWDHGGWQWTIPTSQCQETIRCLKINTIRYQRARVSYHFLWGPNSNSFLWWLFKQCSIEIKPAFAVYPYVGISYFWTHDSPSTNTELRGLDRKT